MAAFPHTPELCLNCGWKKVTQIYPAHAFEPQQSSSYLCPFPTKSCAGFCDYEHTHSPSPPCPATNVQVKQPPRHAKHMPSDHPIPQVSLPHSHHNPLPQLPYTAGQVSNSRPSAAAPMLLSAAGCCYSATPLQRTAGWLSGALQCHHTLAATVQHICSILHGGALSGFPTQTQLLPAQQLAADQALPSY